MLHSVACIIRRNANEFFIARRKSGGFMSDRWEFPGGKQEPGGTLPQTVKREFAEEFGADVSVGGEIAQARFSNNDKEYTLHAYEVFLTDRTDRFTLTEHTEWRWLDFDSIRALPFVDSDTLLFPSIKKWMETRLNANA